MNRTILLPAAYLFDQAVGDPEWIPHPVRLIGAAISRGETLLRSPGQSKTYELLSGTALTLFIVGSTYYITASILGCACRRSTLAGDIAELVLAWTCLAARNLEQEATAVTNALHEDDLPRARQRLARIVGRDTAHLDSREISRAVIETLAESASDGIVAPLFYMAVGGVPLALAYKAVNTLDSMIGHADSRYFYFGKAAARLDDAANYLPSRLCVLGIVAAASLMPYADHAAAWCTWRRDGAKHKSPNAGQPESAMAGALHVMLGGDNTYAGEVLSAPRMGERFPAPTPPQAVQAIRIVSVASLLGLGILVGLLSARRVRHD